MKVMIIVIDSFGIGEMPDSALFGDEGSNTYVNIVNNTGIVLNNLAKLGLNNIDGVPFKKTDKPLASFARLSEKTMAKDTTAGHYEIAGLVMEHPYRIYEKFPNDLLKKIEDACDIKFMGNEVASGTEIIQRLGEEHRATKRPIVYTSADSVMQIAADIDVIPLEKLYSVCEAARSVMVGENSVGRVIARPFKKEGGKFVRTADRKDYALSPPEPTLLDKLKSGGLDVVSIGKIYDIFNGSGITEKIVAHGNTEGLAAIKEQAKRNINGLIFANLVDTDMLYGHRNDPEGYAKALLQIDAALPEIIAGLSKDDLLVITADHGCDPTTASTDHSREYVPLLIYGKDKESRNFGTIEGFDIIAKSVLNFFKLETSEEALF